MLRKRVVTATILIASFLALAYLATPVAWASACIAVTAVAAMEWGRLAGLSPRSQYMFAGVITVLSCAIALAGNSRVFLATAVIGSAFWIFVAPFWLRRRSAMQGKLRLLVAGVAVLSATCASLICLREINPSTLLGVMAIIWISDTVAFFSGRRFGRRKLAVSISPGKTWEGAWCALIAVALYACVWWTLSPETLPEVVLRAPGSLGLTVGIWVLLAMFGIAGDLMESQLKRIAGVKDSGTCLPGHGGVLDRVDALTAALPLAACLYLTQ